jgi:hypothetical protein
MQIPEQLKARQQWLVWKFITKANQKKPAKMPYYATTGNLRGWPYGKPRDGEPTDAFPQVEQGHDLDREHLVDFKTAMERAATSGFDGVGFAFLPGDGLIGIDLDAVCRDKHDSIRDACGTFAEASPSGTGIHIIGLGECETFKSNDVGIEVFCGRQFFTVTGQHDAASPLELRPIPADTLIKLRRTVDKAKEAAKEARGTPAPSPAPAGQYVAPNADASRYCLSALESAVQRLRGAREGGRNDLLNGEAFGLAQLIHTGGISEATIRAALQDAAQACGLPPGEAKATIASGIRAGQQQPRPIPQREHAPRRPEPLPAPAQAPNIDPETGEILDEMPQWPSNDNASSIEPLDIFAEYPAPPMERGMLPKLVEDYAFEQAELIGVSPAMVAMPSLVACAAALHDGIKIQPKRYETDWTESARLWCAVVGSPSVRKTPAMKRATKRLRKIDMDLHDANARAQAEHAQQMEQYKEAKKEAKKTGDYVKQPDAPANVRMVVEDITVEALSEVLKDNARGVLCIQDELSGWFGSMDAYNGGKAGGKDRAHWLEAYNGGGRVVDRVMRGTLKIPNWSVSMIGGIQPDAIRRIAQNMTDDGLMQRFMIIIGQNAVEHDRPPALEVNASFGKLVDHLYAVAPSSDPVELTEEAHRVREGLMAYAAELADYPALPGGLRSHLGKWSGLFARLLLLFHAIECAERHVHPCSVRASGDAAARVDRLMRRFLLPHAVAYYTDVLGASGDLEHSRWVAGHILSKVLHVVSNRDLMQSYKQWRGLDDWRRQRVLQMLEDMGWLMPMGDEPPRAGRRMASSWAVVPAVHQMFADKAASESKRRDRIRAELAAMQAR